MLGKLLFKFFKLVTTEGEGLPFQCVVDFQDGGCSSPSNLTFRVTNFNGFSIYTGNLSKVHENPVLGGLAGLNATSCSIGGAVGSFGLRRGMIGSSPITSLGLLKPPQDLARYENGFSYSFAFNSYISLRATLLGQL